MNGLLKNNIYASFSITRLFAGAMLLFGILAIVLDNDTRILLIGYMLLWMVGLSMCSLTGLSRENATKWGKYKLTLPIKRNEIIKSYFACQIIWLIVGMLIAFASMALSIMLHGFPFDRDTDILMVFVAGAGISLVMGAFFYPLFHIGGGERSEIVFLVSLLCAIGYILGIDRLLIFLFGSKMTTIQILIGAAILSVCAIALFVTSYFLTAVIFKQKEY